MEYRKLTELKKLPNNPRVIKDDQFSKLVQSIKDNPDYFEARPVILSDRTGEIVIIAGNQRYEAAKKIGLKEIPTYLLKDLTEQREREIIIRDNVANGNWDFDILANEWDEVDLENWGVELPKNKDINIEDLFNIEIPFYTPSLITPEIFELATLDKTNELIERINKLDISDKLKDILRIRAAFFADFNFSKIADFYSVQNEEIKKIFEDLGFVILAPKKALENGFIEISENIFEI